MSIKKDAARPFGLGDFFRGGGTGLEQGGSAKQSKQSAQCNDDDRSLRLKQGGVVGAAF